MCLHLAIGLLVAVLLRAGIGSSEAAIRRPSFASLARYLPFFLGGMIGTLTANAVRSSLFPEFLPGSRPLTSTAFSSVAAVAWVVVAIVAHRLTELRYRRQAYRRLVRAHTTELQDQLSLRQEAQQERARLKQQLVRSQTMEAIGRLAASVAHDFNNLLTTIRISGDQLLGGLDRVDPLRRDAEYISQAAQRAGSLVRRLQTFSRPQPLQPTVLDINSVINGTKSMLQRLIREDIELCIVLQPRIGRVKADVGQLEQTILSLAINAHDAMSLGGRLTIETANVELGEEDCYGQLDANAGPHVRLTVHSTGSGMDAETQSHLLEPFFTTREGGQASGLGISTVYSTVRQCGGHVEVNGKMGRGTTVSIYLPRIEEAVPSRSEEVEDHSLRG